MNIHCPRCFNSSDAVRGGSSMGRAPTRSDTVLLCETGDAGSSPARYTERAFWLFPIVL
jgi:hypothetical protein